MLYKINNNDSIEKRKTFSDTFSPKPRHFYLFLFFIFLLVFLFLMLAKYQNDQLDGASMETLGMCRRIQLLKITEQLEEVALASWLDARIIRFESSGRCRRQQTATSLTWGTTFSVVFSDPNASALSLGRDT